MRNKNLDDKGQFKMRLDEEEIAAEASHITGQVDDMRIEKLNQRMTLITILIPVLIVVVLAIAYMDMKKRVIKTEDTGQLTAESLSKELESRFESLALSQKMVEENLARLKDKSDKSVAKVQINLKKLGDDLKNAGKAMATQKEFKASRDKLDRNVANVARSIEELKLQVAQMDQTLQPQIAALEKALSQNKSQMIQLEEKLSALDNTKIDKEKMDVALKLEMLKIKQTLKFQLADLQSRLKSMEKKVAKQATASPATKISSPSPQPSTATPATTPDEPAVTTSGSNSTSGGLEEQTLEK
ncbi:MAG: hypothetical protein PVI54_00660 [Desulfobacteraceae bacterium]|jgi:hypothetical protein